MASMVPASTWKPTRSGETNRPQHTQMVLAKTGPGVADGAHNAGRKSSRPPVKSSTSPECGSSSNAFDGEIAAQHIPAGIRLELDPLRMAAVAIGVIAAEGATSTCASSSATSITPKCAPTCRALGNRRRMSSAALGGDVIILRNRPSSRSRGAPADQVCREARDPQQPEMRRARRPAMVSGRAMIVE